jgi:ABC-type antimicrobial peptide transport system permease subunit
MAFHKGNIKLAFHSLGAAKARSFLTMLGVIIGVASVITIIGIGEGVKHQIAHQSARYGRDVLVVKPNTTKDSLSSIGLSSLNRALSSNDIDTVRRHGSITQAAPIAIISGAVKADHDLNDPLIIATTSDFSSLIKHKIEYGAFFDPEDNNKTAVLGPTIARKLFEDNVPLGQSFTLRGQQFIVAGLFTTFNASPFSLEANLNEAIFIPYTTARTITGSDPGTYQVLARVKAGANVADTASSLHKSLVAAHGGSNDVVVDSVGAENGTPDSTLRLLTMMTFGVAMIAFIVGGIGIMNVMLVSVAERIQEVGLRKAIGASNRQILDQFITEAYVLSGIGAGVGVLLALAATGFLRLFTSLQPVIVWQALVITPIVAVITGVLFGTFPAAKAARRDPIDALRQR